MEEALSSHQLTSAAVLNLINNSLLLFIDKLKLFCNIHTSVGIMPDKQDFGYSFLLAWLRAGSARQGAQVQTDTRNVWCRQVCEVQPRRTTNILRGTPDGVAVLKTITNPQDCHQP